MTRSHSCLWLTIIFAFGFYCIGNASRNNKKDFEATWEEVHHCLNPKPPYAEKSNIVSKYFLSISNGRRYFSGNITVIKPTPIIKISGRMYAIDSSGKRVLKLQMPYVSCRNTLARRLLMLGSIPVQPKTCILKKVSLDTIIDVSNFYSVNQEGIYLIKQTDIDKISHAMISWHDPGTMANEMQLLVGNETMECVEIVIRIAEKNK